MKNNSIQNTLVKLNNLFSDPNRFCKRVIAQNKNGKEINPLSPNAVRWCLRGGLEKCSPNIRIMYKTISCIYMAVMRRHYKRMNLDELNDKFGRQEVLAVIHRAILDGITEKEVDHWEKTRDKNLLISC